jgi:hypothetical protein
MIMEVDAKIDHEHMLNAFRLSATEAIVHHQAELHLDKRLWRQSKLFSATIYIHTKSLIYIKVLCPA